MCGNSGRIDAPVLSGYYSCDFVGGTALWLGSLGYEQSDADTFTGWGMDYLKVRLRCVLCYHYYCLRTRDALPHIQYDSCYAVNETDFVDDYPPIQLEVMSAF